MSDKRITVCSPATAEIVEKKSRFIGIVERVQSEVEAATAVERVRKANRDARHVCYAYLIGGGKCVKASDDGEPSGTAGVPILELIKKTGLDDVVVIVVRYFGGILLGAPGLVRAYSAAAKEAISSAQLGEYVSTALCTVRCEYKDFERIKYLLEQNGAYSITPEFTEDVKIEFKIEEHRSAPICAEISEIFSGRISAAKISSSYELKPI